MKCLPPDICLRVVALGVAGATAKVGLAREHELLQAFGSAKDIERLQCFEKRFRAKFLGPVADTVMARRQHREITMVVRHAKPLGDLANKPYAALFMADMLRPLGFRRRTLARSCISAAKRTRASGVSLAAASSTIMVCTPVSISG